MITLHLINKPGQPLALCQRALVDKDAIILMEDGLYLLASEHKTLASLTDKHPIFYIEADQQARGINSRISTINAVDYTDFVDLTTRYDRVISWF